MTLHTDIPTRAELEERHAAELAVARDDLPGATPVVAILRQGL